MATTKVKAVQGSVRVAYELQTASGKPWVPTKKQEAPANTVWGTVWETALSKLPYFDGLDARGCCGYTVIFRYDSLIEAVEHAKMVEDEIRGVLK